MQKVSVKACSIEPGGPIGAGQRLVLPTGAYPLAAVAVVVAAVVVEAAAVAAAVAYQEQQDDDPPPVVAAEPVADTAIVITTHKNTSENDLELCRSFHGIPAEKKCAAGQVRLCLKKASL